MSPARLIGVGAFVIGGFVLFALALFKIGDRRLFFHDQFVLYAEFAELAGLQSGAKVRVSGMDAGEVTGIIIPPGPTGRFRVRMRVREDLHPLVRTDSVGTIQNDGLVGNKFVQIDTGSERSPAVAVEGTVPTREPFDLADLLSRASGTVDSINSTITQVRGQVEDVLAAVGDTATNTNRLVQSIGADIEAIAKAGRRVSDDASRMVADVRAGRGTLGKLVTDDELYTRVAGIAKETETAVRTARLTAEQVRTTLDGLKGSLEGGQGGGPSVLADLQQTLRSTREAMADLEENTEALKRNFLFRGFYRNRGYFDLNDITAEGYRAGALAGEHREPIRIWISARVLFDAAAPVSAGSATAGGATASADTADVLSSGGRSRLDAAMGELLRFPKSTPLVIEGYAEGGTRDEQRRRASERAVRVRDYLMRRHGLEANRIAIMAMGAQAEGSPQGKTWDGVGLAAWVDERGLQQ